MYSTINYGVVIDVRVMCNGIWCHRSIEPSHIIHGWISIYYSIVKIGQTVFNPIDLIEMPISMSTGLRHYPQRTLLNSVIATECYCIVFPFLLLTEGGDPVNDYAMSSLVLIGVGCRLWIDLPSLSYWGFLSLFYYSCLGLLSFS